MKVLMKKPLGSWRLNLATHRNLSKTSTPRTPISLGPCARSNALRAHAPDTNAYIVQKSCALSLSMPFPFPFPFPRLGHLHPCYCHEVPSVPLTSRTGFPGAAHTPPHPCTQQRASPRAKQSEPRATPSPAPAETTQPFSYSQKVPHAPS